MSTKFKMNNPDGLYFLSTAVVNWIDVFIRKEYAQIVLDSLDYCIREKGLVVYAYVIMSSHIHLIIGRRSNGMQFAEIIRDFKKFTSTTIIKTIKEHPQESRKEWVLRMMQRAASKNSNNTSYQFWQQDNHPIELEGNWIDQKLAYIHNNPVEAGLVREPEDYLYSSAGNYAGREGLLKVRSVYDGIEI